MNTEGTSVKEMGPIGRIVGIFSSPRETFESIDRKPTWLVPFLVILIVTLLLQLLVMDIAIKDRLAALEARDVSAERFEAEQNQMEGPLRYIGLIVTPIGMLVVWAIIAGILLFIGNTLMGGETKFKKVFSVVAWTSLIGLVGQIIGTFLILSKGTTRGVGTNLAILILPTPELGQSSSFLYRVLSKFDVFTIWALALYIIGLAVIYRFTTKKSATLVIGVWAVYVVIAIVLGGITGGLLGG